MFSNDHFSDISVPVHAAFSFIFISIGLLAWYEAAHICADLHSVLAHIACVITSSFIATVNAHNTSHQNGNQQVPVFKFAVLQLKAKGTHHVSVQST
ncbi:MAG: hypothetical protein Q8S84_07475 [bacterium]|nr:hypothetical protein [bacterium]MDP3381287.1 hypothetical protein [bacterium]